MGNNAAFEAFENTVLCVYNKGVLDKELLSALMEPYRDTDIDQGGFSGKLSKKVVGPDRIARKLDAIEICIQTFTGKVPPQPPKLPKEHSMWTPQQEILSEKYWNQRDDAFRKITRKFGWC